MTYPYLTLNPLHISLIINSLSSKSNNYTKVKKLIKLKSNLFSLKQTLSYTFNHTLSAACLSNLYNLKKELIILVLVLKKSKPCFFYYKNRKTKKCPLLLNLVLYVLNDELLIVHMKQLLNILLFVLHIEINVNLI